MTMRTLAPVALATALACQLPTAQAQSETPPAPADAGATVTLPPITVKASADASAQGLSPAFPGGQVARGGRAGILGTKDNLETPFSITSYTNELIQDRQARSVGDVLQNDPGVRMARGFGNFQEAYFIRGFLLSSDDVGYNGLYGLLPRQYIATELFERVEVLRGASAFLTGINPNGGGIGGAINLLPKRAPNEDLSRVTLGVGQHGQYSAAADLARRFGPDAATGVRLNLGWRDGGTAVDDEDARLGVASIGLDWRSRNVRLSADIGYQDNQLDRTRPNVSLGAGVTRIPGAPDASGNFAQDWSYSNERDVFGTFRGEIDLSDAVTAWAAYGGRRSDEANSLANLDLVDGSGAATTSRFDNTREDEVDTGELGLRGRFATGAVGHEWVLSASWFRLEKRNAYAWDFFNTLATDLYDPVKYAQPAFSGGAFRGGDLANPLRTGRTKMTSFAVGDTLSLLEDRLRFTLGLRHQKLDVDTYAYSGEFTNAYRESRTSPALGIVYRIDPTLSVYANSIEGLMQGATLPAGSGLPERTLAPSVSKQKEIGLKAESGRLGFGAALFTTDKPRTDFFSATAQGEDRHTGIELTAYGEAVRGLKLLGGATWLDTEQRDTGVAAAEGKRVIGVPRLQGTLGVEWDVPGAAGLALDARTVYTGSRYADAANALKVPSWTCLDIGARYYADIAGRLLTLRVRIDNLTDRDYWASAGGYPGQGYLVVGAPRTFVLSASVDF
ncbi:MAG: TonB-dependent receptor [Methylibium petroleiphilum]|nr:TonB-dependent receptor [Methylibium petroleiphilum]